MLVDVIFLREVYCYDLNQNYNILLTVLDCVPFLHAFLYVCTPAHAEHSLPEKWDFDMSTSNTVKPA